MNLVSLEKRIDTCLKKNKEYDIKMHHKSSTVNKLIKIKNVYGSEIKRSFAMFTHAFGIARAVTRFMLRDTTFFQMLCKQGIKYKMIIAMKQRYAASDNSRRNVF